MSRPTIVVTGAGSGGHITPLLAVTAEIKRQSPDARVVYIGQVGDKLGDIPAADPNVDQAFAVRAGKFRRYHGEGWRQLLDIPTFLLNCRDALYVLIGLYQSWRLLRQLQPDVIFIKGGFVGVPVGLAAASLHLPYITHDSDAVPGLANRIVGRWARWHAVALPKEIYRYPPENTVTTGIPLQAEFTAVTDKLQRSYRNEIGVPPSVRLLFIIGGGLGSQRINLAVADILGHLLHDIPDLHVVQAVGRANEAKMLELYSERLTTAQKSRVRVYGYIKDVFRYSGAADLIVTRAGATNLAEFAAQGRACLIVPSPFLTGGHQLKNAEVLARAGAAAILPESELLADPNRLARQVTELLHDESGRRRLATKLASFAQPDAAAKLAQLLLEQANAPAP